jgi:hypothetical protein
MTTPATRADLGETLRTTIGDTPVTAVATMQNPPPVPEELLDTITGEHTSAFTMKIMACTNYQAKHKEAQAAVVFKIAQT